MKVEIKKHVCSTCPWLKENAHQLQKETIINMIANGVISACHQEQAKTEGATVTTGVELYAADMKAKDKPFLVCRGFAIARARDNNHANNPMLMQMNQQIKDDGDIDDDRIVGLDYIFDSDITTGE